MSTNQILSKKRFKEVCCEQYKNITYQQDAYLQSQLSRLYQMYRICCQHLTAGDKILSIGAGSAYLESALALQHDISVEIIDFPEMIEINKMHYDHCHFKCIAKDILQVSQCDIPHKHYDLILSSEVVEHLPESPEKHIKRFKESLKVGGFFLLSTPNLGRLSTMLSLLLMNPILPSAEKTFDIVSFDNESIHRREYMPVEIENAFKKNGFFHMFTLYAYKRTSGSWLRRVIYGFASLVPRLNTNFICMARL